MALRICMVMAFDLASPGGVKHHAQHLAAALRAGGDEVTIVGPSSSPIDRPHIHTFGGVVNVRNNGSDNLISLMVAPQTVRRFFRQHQFDVIHVHEPLVPALSYWSVWTTRGVPHVATFHAYDEAEPRAIALARKFGGAIMFPWFRRAIAVSEPAAIYASVAWKRPLALIPNGIDAGIFTPSPNQPGNSAGSPVRLLFVGRLGDRRKGSRFLFEAYRGLLARKLAVTLDVTGELGDTEAPPHLPGLRYHGAVGFERLLQLYRECDGLVAPATGQESFGMVLLEAMACGKPVVCSDIQGYRSVAKPEGAIFFRPGNAPALEEALVRFVELDGATRRRQGESNRRAAEAYDWSLIAGRVRAEYLAAMRRD